jgi:hypothetical protein
VGYDVTIIPLVPALLTGSSNLPGDANGPFVGGVPSAAAALGCLCLPIWSCSVRGLACHACCQARGGLLPHLFTLPRVAPGGLFSVPLSVGSPRPGITRRTALWSSDFPLPRAFRLASAPKSDGGRLRTAAVIRSTATDKYRMVTRGVLCADAGWSERIAARPLCGLPGAVEVSRRTCFARSRDTGIR